MYHVLRFPPPKAKNFQLYFEELMLWFCPENVVYKYTNQSSKYTNGTFHLKSPNVPDEFFYLSITVERFTVYNLVVLDLWIRLMRPCEKI